jgi:hypothetical protein
MATNAQRLVGAQARVDQGFNNLDTLSPGPERRQAAQDTREALDELHSVDATYYQPTLGMAVRGSVGRIGCCGFIALALVSAIWIAGVIQLRNGKALQGKILVGVGAGLSGLTLSAFSHRAWPVVQYYRHGPLLLATADE